MHAFSNSQHKLLLTLLLAAQGSKLLFILSYADAHGVLEDVLCARPVSTEWATPTPSIGGWAGHERADMARRVNDYGTGLVQRHRDRCCQSSTPTACSRVGISARRWPKKT